MRFRLIFFIVTVSLSISFSTLYSQTAQWSPVTENFDAGTVLPTASGWATAGSWTISSAGGHSGANFARLANSLTDKWLFSRSFNAVAGHSYYISYWDQQSTNVAIYICTAQTIASANLANNYINGLNGTISWVQHNSLVFNCTVSGTYYWGMKVTTGAAAMKLDDVTCYEDCSTNAVSATISQSNTSTVTTCYDNAEVLSIVVSATIDNCASISSFTINANGTTNVSDIKNARLWYTGTNPVFTTNSDFGSTTTLYGTVAAPTLANFNINGAQALKAGNNYFWLTYDIKPTATAGNVIDAECPSLTYGTVVTPSVTAPSGSRTIGMPSTLPASFRTCATGSTLDAGNVAVAGNTFSIPVSGSALTNPLSGACNLREVRVKFYGGSADAIDQYTVTIKAPDGTSMVLFSSAFSGLTAGTIDSRFRYSANLTLASAQNYASGFNAPPEPFDQGYYKSQNSFAVFNGKNPIGNWQVIITENAAAANDDFLLDFVELVFGPDFTETNVKSQGDDCSMAIGLNSGVYLGSSAYNPTSSDAKTVEAWDPATTLSGCNWNGSNDNSQWFYFNATKTNVTLSVSGQLYNGVVNNKLQSIVVENQFTPCSGTGTNWSLVACPIAESYSSNTGTYANHKLNFTATIGKTYYLVVDGTAGGLNDFYIDVDGAAAPSVVLPVELLSFDGHCNSNGVQLEWKTATETNNDYFTVERSLDAQNFEPVRVVQGAGNSNSLLTYSCTDENPYNGVTYYRLKQTDFDGQYSYSGIISVEACSKNNFSVIIAQNPATNTLNLIIHSDTEDNISVYLHDVTGRIIDQKKVSVTEEGAHVSMDVSKYANGIYFISVISAKSNNINKKQFIINN